MYKGVQVQVAGTFRESETTKRFWGKRKLSVSDVEKIWTKKEFERFSQEKEEVLCLPH
jgi:hypothetical protein